jgi:hypothetical protein
MISEILSRLPDYTISGEIERFADAGDVYAVRRLPVRFTPGPRSSRTDSAATVPAQVGPPEPDTRPGKDLPGQVGEE